MNQLIPGAARANSPWGLEQLLKFGNLPLRVFALMVMHGLPRARGSTVLNPSSQEIFRAARSAKVLIPFP
jgi:hypothetical protein